MNRPQTTVEDNWITRNRKTVLKVLGLVVLFAALYFVRRDLLAALQPFFYGIVLAFLFNPLANRLDAMGVKRWQSALLLALLLLALMVLFVGLFIPSVVRDALQLAQRLPSGVASLRVKYADEIARVTDWMAGLGTDIPSNLGTRLGSTITSVMSSALTRLGGLIHILLTPVISFYLIKDKQKILAELRGLFNDKHQRVLYELWTDIHRVLSGYVKGRLLVSVYIGIATGVGCMIIGLPNALTIGIVAGLFDLIPYFGPWLGGILPVLVALMSPEPIKAVWVIILIVVVQQIEINLITPRIISENVGMHPLLVMFSVLFFGRVMGVMGMIIGVPVMGSLIVLFIHIRRSAKRDAALAIVRSRAPGPPMASSPSENPPDMTPEQRSEVPPGTAPPPAPENPPTG